jgi:hypothetical protein
MVLNIPTEELKSAGLLSDFSCTGQSGSLLWGFDRACHVTVVIPPFLGHVVQVTPKNVNKTLRNWKNALTKYKSSRKQSLIRSPNPKSTIVPEHHVKWLAWLDGGLHVNRTTTNPWVIARPPNVQIPPNT